MADARNEGAQGNSQPPTANRQPGAGGDPYAVAVLDNPYAILPDVQPNDAMPQVLRVYQQLQRRGLKPTEDSALRVLRDLRARLMWDLFTLGTTPHVDENQWDKTRELLAQDQREAAVELWLRGIPEQPNDPNALHVRAVLAANELVWLADQEKEIGDRALAAFVGRWAALLSHSDWVWAFMEHRCKVWQQGGGSSLNPDIADNIQLLDRAGKRTVEILSNATHRDVERERQWRARWERERAAIDMLAIACGRSEPPGRWAKGFGPLGLEEIGQAEKAQRWLIREIGKGGNVLAIGQLRERKAGFSKDRPDESATAALAVRCALSSLGHLAADVWTGNGRRAVESMNRDESDAQDPWFGTGEDGRRAVESTERDATDAQDPWFGTGEDGRRAKEATRRELRTEALLLQFREELGREDVPISEVCDTVREILRLAGGLAQSARVVEAIEGQLSGRVLTFVEGRTPPHAGEVARVLSLAREIRALLAVRDAGHRSAHDVATLLTKRAAYAWNRLKGLPGPKNRQRILRDLFEAVELCPQNPDIVESLASVLYQVHGTMGSPAEGRDLLERARHHIDHCLERSAGSADLRSLRRQITEVLDPEAAMREAWAEIDGILSSGDAGGNHSVDGHNPQDRETG